MTRNRFRILAGIAGAALATWWIRHRRPGMTPSPRGEVIFSNRPEA